MSLKDWVVHSAEATRSRGVAINRFGSPEFDPLTSPLWSDGMHDTSTVWVDEAFMPDACFPSDHVSLAAQNSFSKHRNRYKSLQVVQSVAKYQWCV